MELSRPEVTELHEWCVLNALGGTIIGLLYAGSVTCANLIEIAAVTHKQLITTFITLSENRGIQYQFIDYDFRGSVSLPIPSRLIWANISADAANSAFKID